MMRGRKDLVVRHAITLKRRILDTQAAVGTHAHAVIRRLDQRAQVYLAAHIPPTHAVGLPP